MRLTSAQIALLAYEGASLTYAACFFTINANTLDLRLHTKFTYWSYLSALIANITTTLQSDKLSICTKQVCKAALAFNLILPIAYYTCVFSRIAFTQSDSPASWYGLLNSCTQSFNAHCIHPIVSIQHLLSEPIRQQLAEAKLNNIPHALQQSAPILTLFSLYAITLFSTMSFSCSERPVYDGLDHHPLVLLLVATLATLLTHYSLTASNPRLPQLTFRSDCQRHQAAGTPTPPIYQQSNNLGIKH